MKNVGKACVCLLLSATAFLAANAWSTPAMEGDVVPLNISLQLPGPAGTAVARAQIQRKGSTFLRLRLAGFVDDGGGDFTISVKDADFQERAIYRRVDLVGQQELWSALIPFDTAVIELTAVDHANPPRISFFIDQMMYESRGAKVLSIAGRDQRRWLVEFKDEKDAALQKAAASVAKLVFVREGGGFTCTGFMVSDSLMLTNRHCIATVAECRTAQAVFGYELDEKNRLRVGPQHGCQEVVKVGGPELDFSLLRLTGAPGRTFGKLTLKPDNHVENDRLVMVQHPYGEAKQVSRDDCVIKTVSAPSYESSRETDFGHTCDTLNGSSGSPMLNEAMQVVGLHHLGFDLASRRWGRENRAVSVRFILPLIETNLTVP